MLHGTARVDGGRVRVEIGSRAEYLDTTVTGVTDGAKVTVAIRPQDCALTTGERSEGTDPDGGASAGISAEVAYFEHLLEFGLATSTVAGMEEGIVVQTPAQQSYEPEQRVTITAPAERVYLFDADSGDRLR